MTYEYRKYAVREGTCIIHVCVFQIQYHAWIGIKIHSLNEFLLSRIEFEVW